MERDFVRRLVTRDRISGAFITALGIFVLWGASGLRIGTLTQMGPGMMPTCVGVLLSLIGIAIAVSDTAREAAPSFRHARPLIALCIAFLVFAVLIETAGLAISVFAAVVISRFASPGLALWETLLCGAAGAILAVLLFVELLGLPIQIWPW